MKKQSLRSRSRAGSGSGPASGSGSTTPIPVRHQFDHEVPTVIHHPEEKMTALARLTQRLLREPGRFATWVLGILAVIGAVYVAANWTSSRRTKTSELWNSLYNPETKPEVLAENAKKYRGTAASEWALLHAANEYYTTAMGDLPNNRDVAINNVNKALELYQQIAKDAPKDSFQARAAALRKGPLPGSALRAFSGDRAICAPGQHLARHARSGRSQRTRGSTQEAGSRCILQRAVHVLSTEGHAAAPGQRTVQLPGQLEREGGSLEGDNKHRPVRDRPPAAG